MKLSVILTLLLLLLVLAKASNDEDDSHPNVMVDADYHAWKQEHGISYDEAEDRYRLFLYKQKQREIEEHNSNSAHTWKKGHNQFSALTQEEFENTYLTGIVEPT